MTGKVTKFEPFGDDRPRVRHESLDLLEPPVCRRIVQLQPATSPATALYMDLADPRNPEACAAEPVQAWALTEEAVMLSDGSTVVQQQAYPLVIYEDGTLRFADSYDTLLGIASTTKQDELLYFAQKWLAELEEYSEYVGTD